MQFVLDKPIEEGLQPVGFNHEQLKAEISAIAETYKGLVVTEETIKEAKATKAKLNAFRKALEDERIRVKKLYQQPLIEFEAKVKELTALIDVPILEIDDQLKEFEMIEKTRKKEQIEAYYKNAMKDLADLVRIEQIWNNKWLNATYKLQDVWDEIDELAYKVREDIKSLRGMNLKHEDSVMDVYIRTLDFRAAVAKDKAMTEQEERMAKIVPMPKQKPEAPQQTAINGTGETIAMPVVEKQEELETADDDLIKPIDVRIYVTEKQKIALKQFLNYNKIRYASVPKNR